MTRMQELLRKRLRGVISRRLRLGLLWRLALCWLAAAALGGVLLLAQRASGSVPLAVYFALPVAALIATTAVTVRHLRRGPDYRWIAAEIERRHPDLRGMLLTAVQQEGRSGGELGYLQHRLLEETVDRCVRSDWRDAVPSGRLALAHAAHAAALGLFVATLLGVNVSSGDVAGAGEVPAGNGLAVTPGDTSLERGSSLVVLARFGAAVPASVSLVVDEIGQPPRTIPLVKSLADPVFGAAVPEVAADLAYHLEYGGKRTRDFKVTVFEYPRLVRADAGLTFPGYTAQPPRRVEDTRRITAVEGTRLDLALQLNKPVAKATLVPRDKDGIPLPLTVAAGQATASLQAFVLGQSHTYDLQLVDADGRANKLASPFVFDVAPNRTPEIKIALPRGDLSPSPLEEIAFEGTVWDDFGSPAYGLSYTVAGREPKTVELGRAVPAKEKRPFGFTLRLEELGVAADQLISWSVWADDIGPDGTVRRTSSDLFFAEVRPFEEIYRQGQGSADSDEPQENESGEQQGQGNQSQRLAELQKQIVSATWKLQRQAAASPVTKQYADDAAVVRDSQSQAIEQAGTAKKNATDSRTQALWTAATGEMEKALAELKDATRGPEPLPRALVAEQAAYQALLKLQAREHEVVRSRNRSGRQSGGQQANRRQLDQLDLAEEQNRYETQSQARAQQTPERREQQQVMNRLQELARRQQDLNDRLRELQAALQEARTETEREEARRQLKRLQEEQQRMLADVDELGQRMDRTENQSRLADERRQLERTRGEVQRAAEAVAQGQASQALSSGTRAQRQLQELRDDMRKQNSSRFADDLRQMRADARQLARNEESLGQQIGALGEAKRKTLADSPERTQLKERLAEQKKRVDDLVERATQLSQQAETSEPLLSRELYDTLRKVSQDETNSVKQLQQELIDGRLLTRRLLERLQELRTQEGAARSLEMAGELLDQDYAAQAGAVERRARASLDVLQKGVERAAGSVIGDDAEALKLAQQELDSLTGQVQQEMRQAGQQGQQGQGEPGRPAAGTQAENRAAGQPSGDGRAGAAGETAAREERAGAQNETRTSDAGRSDSSTRQSASRSGVRPGGSQRLAQTGGDGRGQQQPAADGTPADIANLLNAGGGERDGNDVGVGTGGRGGVGPITGENFGAWSDGLRDVEEMIDASDLRDAVANARERARLLRQEFVRDRKKPDWAVVQLEIVKPLVEVRQRIAEDLSRRNSAESLALVDRDPVPGRYAERVRRYYEELGKDGK